MDRSRTLLVAALLVVAAACGKSAEEEAFEQIEAECFGLVGDGRTWEQAIIQLDPHNRPGFTDCATQWSTLEGSTCAEWTAANPQCRVQFLWVPRDPALCRSGGACCLMCDIRIMRDQLILPGGFNLDAPICGAEFVRGVFC